jgi:hypothetical protein
MPRLWRSSAADPPSLRPASRNSCVDARTQSFANRLKFEAVLWFVEIAPFMAKIKKTRVDEAMAGSNDFHVWDSELPRSGLKVTPVGGTVYLLQYRVGGRGARTRRVMLGVHGTFAAYKARNEAQAILLQIARGGDLF